MTKPKAGTAPKTGTAVAKVQSLEVATTEEAKARATKYLQMMGTALNEEEISVFVDICGAFQLNPFTREIYGIPRWDSKKGVNILTIVVGYEVYLKRAERTGLLRGWKCWTEGEDTKLKACVSIKREGWDEPFYHEVLWPEYAQMRYDKDGQKWVLTKFWKDKPHTMLKKVCIGQAFRLCFPEHIGGMPYAQDEIATDDGVIVQNNLSESQLRKTREVEHEVVDGEPDITDNDAQAAGHGLSANEPATQDVEPTPEPEPPPQATDASPGPEGTGEAAEPCGAAEMYKAMSDELAAAGNLNHFAMFMVSKKWIREDQSLDDLTENQIVRLWNNKPVLMGLFAKWQAAQTTEGDA